MTSLTPPPGARSDGPRRRIAVDYQQLGYGAEELPATAAVNPAPPAPVEVAQLVAPGVLVADPDPALVSDVAARAVPPDADAEEQDWWAQGEDIPASPVSSMQAEPLPRGADRRPQPDGAPGPVAAVLSRILGLERLGSPRRAAGVPTPVHHGDDGPADPVWLLGQPGADTDSSQQRPSADADGQPVRATGPRSAAAAVRARVSSTVAPADVEVSRAPRELGATVRRALVGLVLVLIAFAGIKQVIWNPIFGRTGAVAAGPAVMDQVAADGAATRYALDYLSFSPRSAAAAAAAVSADVVPGGDNAPAQWAGTGYVRADTALPTGWHVVDPTRAVVAVMVRVHLAMPPGTAAGPAAAQTGSTTPQGLADLAPATVPAPSTTAAREPQPAKEPPGKSAAGRATTSTHPAPAAVTTGKSTPEPAPTTPAAAAPPVSTPATVAAVPVSTPPPPAGSAGDPGAVPAGWTDLGSRWLTLAVPVETSGGGVKVSTTGAILTGEPAGQIAVPANAMPDPATATATSSVATSFFTAYAQSDVAYLAQPGVNLTGLSAAVTLASLANWTVSVPTTPGTGSSTATSGVGSAAVTWQLAGTDLQVQQNYAIALTNSQSRWYIAALSPAASTSQP